MTSVGVSTIVGKVVRRPAEAPRCVFRAGLTDEFQGEGGHQVTGEKMDEPQIQMGGWAGPPWVRVQSRRECGPWQDGPGRHGAPGLTNMFSF